MNEELLEKYKALLQMKNQGKESYTAMDDLLAGTRPNSGTGSKKGYEDGGIPSPSFEQILEAVRGTESSYGAQRDVLEPIGNTKGEYHITPSVARSLHDFGDASDDQIRDNLWEDRELEKNIASKHLQGLQKRFPNPEELYGAYNLGPTGMKRALQKGELKNHPNIKRFRERLSEVLNKKEVPEFNDGGMLPQENELEKLLAQYKNSLGDSQGKIDAAKQNVREADLYGGIGAGISQIAAGFAGTSPTAMNQFKNFSDPQKMELASAKSADQESLKKLLTQAQIAKAIKKPTLKSTKMKVSAGDYIYDTATGTHKQIGKKEVADKNYKLGQGQALFDSKGKLIVERAPKKEEGSNSSSDPKSPASLTMQKSVEGLMGLKAGALSTMSEKDLRKSTSAVLRKTVREIDSKKLGLSEDRLGLSGVAEKRRVSQFDKRMEEKDFDDIQKIVKTFNSDKSVSKANEKLSDLNIVINNLNDPNKIGDQSVATFMTRAAGEVGAMTEADKAPFGGSKSIIAKLSQLKTDYFDPDKGLTDENRKFLIDLTTTMHKSYKQNKLRRALEMARQQKTDKFSEYILLSKFTGANISKRDKQAIEWLRKNPKDPNKNSVMNKLINKLGM